jgi:hypothetical protein
MNHLAQAVAQHNALRERLLAAHADLDEETLSDTLEGLTELNELIAAVVRAALDDEAHAEGLAGRLRHMQVRLERLQARARRRRDAAAMAMAEAGISRIVSDDMTLSLRRGTPALVVTDEGVIPPSYWRAGPPKLDRRALLQDIKTGDKVAGAELSNPPPVLSVRTK